MSSQSIQYVYIPNLVGRQVLRVPVLPCEDQVLETTPGLCLTMEPQSISIDTTQQSPLKRTDSAYSRESSPAPSIDSVSEEE